MDNHRYILSICIPTYNRVGVLKRNVEEWLKSPCKDFSIAVCDNASTDGTYEVLSQIKDDRLFVFRNDVNVGGWENAAKALEHGQGKYSMILMDKDSVDLSEIEYAIEILRASECVVGHFVLNTEKSDPKVALLRKSTSCIDSAWRKQTLGYVHPSGYFFLTSLIKCNGIFASLRSQDTVIMPYSTDFQVLYMLRQGDFLELKMPMVYMNRPPFEGSLRSYTYKEGDDLYFLPEFRVRVFVEYFRFADKIGVSVIARCLMLKRVFKRLRSLCTSYFESMLKDDDYCHWYGISDSFRMKRLGGNHEKEYLDLLRGVKGLPLMEAIYLRIYLLCSCTKNLWRV